MKRYNGGNENMISSQQNDALRRRERFVGRFVGQFRGKGPKNYRRSDERIREDVLDRLTDDADVDASEIEVAVQSSEVTLMGLVNERFEKRRAEEIAESVSGVTNVENRLKVQPNSPKRNNIEIPSPATLK